MVLSHSWLWPVGQSPAQKNLGRQGKRYISLVALNWPSPSRRPKGNRNENSQSPLRPVAPWLRNACCAGPRSFARSSDQSPLLHGRKKRSGWHLESGVSDRFAYLGKSDRRLRTPSVRFCKVSRFPRPVQTQLHSPLERVQSWAGAYTIRAQGIRAGARWPAQGGSYAL